MLKLQIGIIVMLILSLIGNGFQLGCKSFNPKDYVIEGQPDECNDYYITLGAYANGDGKDFAFPAVLWTECNAKREAKIREEVQSYKTKIDFLCKSLYPTDIESYRKCVKL